MGENIFRRKGILTGLTQGGLAFFAQNGDYILKLVLKQQKLSELEGVSPTFCSGPLTQFTDYL